MEIAIKRLLEEIISPLIGEGKVYPIFGLQVPCVTYTIKPITGGVIKESQLEVKIIDKDIDEILKIREKIELALDMEANKPSLLIDNVVLRSQLSGGGIIFNDSIQVWEDSLIFIVNWRKKK